MLEPADERLLLDEREIRFIADELFILTDRKEWALARALFVDGTIEVDMSSLVGGRPVRVTAAQLFAGFAAGLHPQKQSHHMATNYRIRIEGERATLWAHGYSWNRLVGRSELWETWGNYELGFAKTPMGWRLNAFRYIAKYNRGDDSIRTHTI